MTTIDLVHHDTKGPYVPYRTMQKSATTAFFAGAQIAAIAYDRGWPPIVYRDDEVQGIRLEVPESGNVVRLEVVHEDPGTSNRTALPDKAYVINNDRGTRS